MTKLSALLFIPVVLSIAATAQVTTPRTPSPAATVAQTIGISTVTVHYSRPAVKGREIWGKLVPYGWNVQGFGLGKEAPWRAGANENTTITFSHDATVQGQPVPAGTYGLFFVVNADNTGEVVLSKDSRSWGSFFYEPTHDLMRAKIQLRDIANTELLTYDFANLTKTSADMVLNWEKKQFPVKIEFDVDNIVMKNADEELKGPVGFNWIGYASAANYALQNKVNLDKAAVWADQAVGINANFNTLSLKADVLRGAGKTEEADKTMAEAVAGATEAELNAYGYQLINQQQQEKAIEMFILNTQRHPKSANVWDSLGEAYALKGDKKNAITNFKKSLSLSPPDNVRQNSEKYLKQLGAM